MLTLANFFSSLFTVVTRQPDPACTLPAGLQTSSAAVQATLLMMPQTLNLSQRPYVKKERDRNAAASCKMMSGARAWLWIGST